MGITVNHNYFTNTDEVYSELTDLGVRTSEVDAPPSGGTPIHWHSIGLWVYITKGVFRFQDPENGEVHECSEGSRFVIPERTLHIEEAHSGYSAIVGTRGELSSGEPFVRSPAELDVSAES